MNINYEFLNPQLLEKALTHRSFSSTSSNERMEFLGDAVLDLVITEYVYANYPHLQEGELAKMRAEVVCAESLARVAEKLELSKEMILGKSEQFKDENAKSSILADAVEAVIAAVYLDGGLSVIQPMILEWLKDEIDKAAQSPGMKDYKTRLQELVAKEFEQVPEYEISSEGPDHSKNFYASVKVSSKNLGTGVGSTKKEATQRAAKQAYELLEYERLEKLEKQGQQVK